MVTASMNSSLKSFDAAVQIFSSHYVVNLTHNMWKNKLYK